MEKDLNHIATEQNGDTCHLEKREDMESEEFLETKFASKLSIANFLICQKLIIQLSDDGPLSRPFGNP